VDVCEHDGSGSIIFAWALAVVQAIPPVICLMGPTAAGKTDLALEWAERYPVEIISVDSAMIYRGMDIGTGKPSADVLRRIPHRLVDIRDPTETYSAGQFVRDAQQCIQEIRLRNKVPLLVGGTMLYYRALMYGIAEMPSGDASVREQIDREAIAIGWPAMHAQLAAIDPEAALRIMPNDAQRIQRALEVFRLSGKTQSALHAQTKPSDESFVGLVWSPQDRSTLHQRIADRFVHMLKNGFLDEVRRLYELQNFNLELPAFRSVGYRQLLENVRGKVTLDIAVERGIIATRQLARRQLIWLRGMTSVRWYDSGLTDSLLRITNDFRAAVGS
jgi:tRNA dimethylallyltransferase